LFKSHTTHSYYYSIGSLYPITNSQTSKLKLLKKSYDDMVIGAYRGDKGGDPGKAFIVYGSATIGSSGSIELASLNVSTGITIGGFATGDYCGYSASGAGDVNGDG
jgi:hypothetical protein